MTDIDDFKRELDNLLERARACELNALEVSLALNEAADEIDDNAVVSLTHAARN